jgi:hypothetical protein
MDPDEIYPVGDLKKSNFRDIWFGEPYNKYREEFRKNWRESTICSECTFSYKGGSCDGETIVQIHFLNEDRSYIKVV